MTSFRLVPCGCERSRMKCHFPGLLRFGVNYSESAYMRIYHDWVEYGQPICFTFSSEILTDDLWMFVRRDYIPFCRGAWSCFYVVEVYAEASRDFFYYVFCELPLWVSLECLSPIFSGVCVVKCLEVALYCVVCMLLELSVFKCICTCPHKELSLICQCLYSKRWEGGEREDGFQ